MPTQVKGLWKCAICNKMHYRDIDALSCEQSHEVIYVPILREDLMKLIQFIYTGDTTLISKNLMSTLMKYRSQMSGKNMSDV